MCGDPNQTLAAKGRFGDTELAHVNPREKLMLKAMGGAGTINPDTGLKEYYQRGTGGDRGGGRMTGDSAEEKRHAKIRQQLNEKYGGNWGFNTRTYKWEDPGTEKKLDDAQAQKWSEYSALVEQEQQAKRDYWDAKWNRGPLGAIQDKLNDLTNQIQNFSFDINYDEWELPTPQELLTDIEEFYQGSDLDNTFEDIQDTDLDPNQLIDMGEDVQEEYEELQDVGDQVVSDAEDAAESLEGELSNVLTNTTNIGSSVSNQLQAILGVPTSGPNDDQMNAMASMEGDPRLASLLARRRRSRKQGKSQLRKGGGLYIPLKAGIQVQT
tara:strand:+ start:87 stop:1058 length:972 start_codon:yes stop_codon:yes gene_type:complete